MARTHGRDLSGEELAEVMGEFANKAREQDVDEFVIELTRGTHRTLQQRIAHLMVRSFEEWAALTDNQYDLRNDATVKLAKKFVAATGDKYDRHLPLI